jgi:hypothetical protein
MDSFSFLKNQLLKKITTAALFVSGDLFNGFYQWVFVNNYAADGSWNRVKHKPFHFQ